MIPRSVWYAGVAAIAAATSFVAVAARPVGVGDSAAPDGAQVFSVKGCATCHQGPTSGAMVGGVGPSLADASSWAGARVEGLSAEDYLAQSIRTPSAFISSTSRDSSGPGAGQMPLLQMSDVEIDAVVAYLLATSDESD